jgi:hypothetical protein
LALQNAVASGHLQPGPAAHAASHGPQHGAVAPPRGASPAAPAQPTAGPKPRFETVYVSVRGRRTSLTLPPDLVEQARALCPSSKQLRVTLQQLAEAAPMDGTSRRRSQWVASRLLESLRAGAEQDAMPGHSVH